MDPRVQHQATKREVPCAGCRMLHRKCTCDCMLAPYFPASETEKFAIVHKVFGASNVIKMLQVSFPHPLWSYFMGQMSMINM